MSARPGGIQVTGFLDTFGLLDTYATHLDILGQGGHHTVSTLADLQAISTERRKFGMTATVSADPTPANNGKYTLKNIILGGVSDVITNNTNWIKDTAASYTINNGLNEVAGVLRLGGPLLVDTDITGAFSLKLGTSGSKLTTFEINTSGASSITANSLTIAAGSPLSGIQISSAGVITVTDGTAGPRGLRGASDYAANVQSLDYVQKSYVDIKLLSKAASATLLSPGSGQNGYGIIWNNTTSSFDLQALPGSVYTFTNGLTNSSGTVRLGGALTQHTTITGAIGLYDFIVGTSSDRVDSFKVAADDLELYTGTGTGLKLVMTSTNFTLSESNGSGSSAITTSGSHLNVSALGGATDLTLTAGREVRIVGNLDIQPGFSKTVNIQCEDIFLPILVESPTGYAVSYNIATGALNWTEIISAAESGITAVSGTIKLGGLLTDDASITGDTGTYSINLGTSINRLSSLTSYVAEFIELDSLDYITIIGDNSATLVSGSGSIGVFAGEVIITSSTSSDITLNSLNGYIFLDNTTGVYLGSATNAQTQRSLYVYGSATNINLVISAKGNGHMHLAADEHRFYPNTAGHSGLTLTHSTTTSTLKILATTSVSAGDHLTISGGDSGPSGTVGGNLTLTGGAPIGGGTYGYIILQNIPTSSAGLPTGAIWKDIGAGNVLKMV